MFKLQYCGANRNNVVVKEHPLAFFVRLNDRSVTLQRIISSFYKKRKKLCLVVFKLFRQYTWCRQFYDSSQVINMNSIIRNGAFKIHRHLRQQSVLRAIIGVRRDTLDTLHCDCQSCFPRTHAR